MLKNPFQHFRIANEVSPRGEGTPKNDVFWGRGGACRPLMTDVCPLCRGFGVRCEGGNVRAMRARDAVGSLLLLAALGATASSCASGGQRLITLMPGVVNDPKNRTLRREILKFGSEEFCKELVRRGAPLKLRDDAPAMGRFFAEQCTYQELDGDDAFVQFGGHGYGWTQPSGRLGFYAAASIRYNPDLLVDDGTLYAYYRARSVQSTKFDAIMVERTQAAGVVGALLNTSAQDLANKVGAQILGEELGRGFTVLRSSKGDVDFGLGVIEKGKKPFHPFEVHGTDKLTLASDWSEIHAEQREFLGPFLVDDDKRALFMTMTLDGAPAIDVFVMRKDAADPWLRDYVLKPGATPLPAQPLMSDVLPGKTEWRRSVPLAKGTYFVVLDHTSSAGQVAPQTGPAGVLGPADLAAVARYVIQLGDAP